MKREEARRYVAIFKIGPCSLVGVGSAQHEDDLQGPRDTLHKLRNILGPQLAHVRHGRSYEAVILFILFHERASSEELAGSLDTGSGPGQKVHGFRRMETVLVTVRDNKLLWPKGHLPRHDIVHGLSIGCPRRVATVIYRALAASHHERPEVPVRTHKQEGIELREVFSIDFEPIDDRYPTPPISRRAADTCVGPLLGLMEAGRRIEASAEVGAELAQIELNRGRRL